MHLPTWQQGNAQPAVCCPTIGDGTGDPHRRLAAAVLLRAVLDVKGETLAPQPGQTRGTLRAAALTWLHSPDADDWAELVDVDPEWLRRVK